MRPVNSLKSALFQSLYRSSLISTFLTLVIVALLVFLSIEKDLREEGQYLGKLVFKELRQAMNTGASYERINTLLDEINADAPGINYTMHRSSAIQQQFGEGRNLSPELEARLTDRGDATYVESLSQIHYYRAIKFQQECLACHKVEAGQTAGVLDITFPANRIRIPISEVLMGLFLVFSITMISSYLALSTDLLSHVVNPLRRLERKLRTTKGHHNLDEKLALDSNLRELVSIERSFNAQQDRLRKAFQKVEEVSIYDQLTNTYNRHQLDRLFTEETLRALRQKTPMTIAMIDLNGFKQINDTHGHQAGDEILVNFCNMLSTYLRVTDKVIRYGGDEFIVLLPNCTREKAKALFTRIEEISHQEPYFYKGHVLYTQFSAGAVEFPREASSEDGFDLIQTADARMYQDKQSKKQGKS